MEDVFIHLALTFSSEFQGLQRRGRIAPFDLWILTRWTSHKNSKRNNFKYLSRYAYRIEYPSLFPDPDHKF
jgi:hypothetical protein